ncbi:MAG: hypothetical protein QOJ98_3473 [Acidobacteriota bacterium]|nr:hypothetical protein [Acidobacteriota bacterium]
MPGREAYARSHEPENRLIRQVVRTTAGKILRSEDLTAGEKEMAVGILRGNPEFGNPHAVRCGWCHESRTLFRDENDGPFELTSRGWLCVTCDVRAASQEIKF